MRAQRARRRARARRGRVHRKGRDDRRRSPLAAAGAVNRGRPRLRALPRARGRRPGPPSAPAAGRVSRRDPVAAAVESERCGADVQPPASRRPRLAPRGATAREGPTPCRRARGGCLEVFCGEACRDAARGWHAMTCLGSCGEGSPMFEFGKHARRSHESFLLAADALPRPADAGGSDGAPRRGGCGGGGGFRTRGKTFVVGDDERRRRRVEPSRRVAMDASLRESSRIRIQFHEVGRRPRASRPLPRGRREEPPTKKIGAPRVAPRGDAPRANRRRAPAPVHGLGPGSRSAFGRDP